MNRIERLSAILIHLQSKKVVKAAELAERFSISLRTVYRDIRALEEAGVPIGAEAGTGYFLLDSFHLSPVSFSLQEASALLMGEKLMDKMSDHETSNHYRSALTKIRAILKPGEKDYLELLYDAISVRRWDMDSLNLNKLFIHEIQEAIAKKKVLKINYHARYSGEATSRLVEPIGLCNYDSMWHLIAWCRLRKGYRDFRLDRIKSLSVTDESFECKKLIGMNEYFSKYFFLAGEVNIRIEVSTQENNILPESKFWYGFRDEEKLPNGNLLLSFANNDLQGFSRWLISSGVIADAIFPEELKNIITEKVNRLKSYLGD